MKLTNYFIDESASFQQLILYIWNEYQSSDSSLFEKDFL